MKEFTAEDFFISPEPSLYEAMRQFETNGLGVLFVVDSERHLLGSLTDGDIRRALLQGKSMGLNIRLIMNPNPVALRHDCDAKEGFLLTLSQKGYYPFIPVIDDQNKVVSVVSIRDVLPSEAPRRRKDKGKRILVVGGAGYIGSLLVRELLAEGYSVRVFDAMLYGDDSLRDLYNRENFECIVGDTRNLKQVYEAVEGTHAVVHLGEVVGDPACSLDQGYTTSVNHSATESLVNICRDRKVDRFVYISSCSVYGFGTEIFNEESEPNPVSLYGRTKLDCERIILSKRQNGFCPTILRLSTVFGWSYRPRFDLVVNQFTLEACTQGSIKVCGGGQWRPFVHVSDVVRAIQLVLNADPKVVRHQVFNVGSEDLNLRILDVATTIQKVYPRLDIVIDTAIRDQRNYRVDFSKIRDVLGFQRSVSFEEGVRTMGAAIERQPERWRTRSNTRNESVLNPGFHPTHEGGPSEHELELHVRE